MTAWHTRLTTFAIALGLAALLIPTLGAQSDRRYRDPNGRFTVLVPTGWSATQLNPNALQLAFGSTYVTLMVLPGADAESNMRMMAGQMSGQWKNWSQLRQGRVVFGGRAGSFLTFSGLNPKGVDSHLQLISAADSSRTYLLMTSAPHSDFVKLRPSLDVIEQSVTIAAGATRESGPPVTYRMRLARLVDRSGFERPMTALSLLLPADWSFTGSPIYMTRPGCPANLVRLAFKASSPDNRITIELMPSKVWQWADNQTMLQGMQQSNAMMASAGGEGCAIGPPMNAETFLRRVVVPDARAGARVVGAEVLPEAITQLRAEASTYEDVAARQGIPLRIRGDAARIRLEYSLNGQPFEESLAAIVVAADTTLPTPFGPTLFSNFGADHLLAARVPQGQLDREERLLRVIMGSIKVDQQWQWRVQETVKRMEAEAAAQAGERARVLARASQDTARIIHETYQNSSRSREHSMEGWSQYMRGVQSYRNTTSGDTVDLPSEFGHAWAGPNGQYLVTDSATFNPNQSGGTWTKLEPTRQ